ncbi:proline-rich protein 15 [Acomys russatus]|uniref:proline-rich protein 15 n=1 Tax=Acomys russatus TaxID=60746 RepID=UPI0021E1CDE0|nr:proline-rich protein 15 [Acomys russatus]
MADSGSSTSSSGPWWKSLTRKKSKEVTVGVQPQVQAETKTPLPNPSPPPSDRTSSSRENQHSNVLGDTGESPRSDMCEEKSGSSRRNLKISRSGRFKEKRKVRATLIPEGDRSPEEADFPDDPQEDKQ